jgi:hypothetical protein
MHLSLIDKKMREPDPQFLDGDRAQNTLIPVYCSTTPVVVEKSSFWADSQEGEKDWKGIPFVK